VCQICIVTDHRNHVVEPLDKVADGERAKIVAAAEKMKEKSKFCSVLVLEFEQTAANLETNITAAKRKVSQAAEQMITKIREREQEAITDLENTRVSRMEKLNAAKTQVQSLIKQINQAVEFASNLIQGSSSSDIMQNKNNLQKRFDDLKKIPLPVLQVSSFVKFVATAEPEILSLGFMATIETDLHVLHGSTVEGLIQDFQAGVEAKFVVCPKLGSDAQQKIHVAVDIVPTEEVGSLMTCKKEDGSFLVKFTPKVPGTYNIKVTINDENLHNMPFTVHVKERQLEVVDELDLKGETLQNPVGIAVNSKGLIAVVDCSGHCILIFDREGKYLRKLGCKGENAGQLNCPRGITYLNEDEILVADTGNNRIQQLNVNTGNVVNAFGKYGTGKGEFHNPASVCVDDEGRIVIADFNNNRMQVVTKDGVPVSKFGDSGAGKLNHPSGCIYHQNTFIISDSWNKCLKMFDRSGRFLRKVGQQVKSDRQLNFENFPRGLCVEKCGNHHNVLVCDQYNARIVQYSLEGFFTGKTVSKLEDPIGVAVTPDGRILVSDFKAKKVYIVK